MNYTEGAWDRLVSLGAEVTEDMGITKEGRSAPRLGIRWGSYYRGIIPSAEVDLQHAMDVAAWRVIEQVRHENI